MATVDPWIAAKNATQCTARTTPFGTAPSAGGATPEAPAHDEHQDHRRDRGASEHDRHGIPRDPFAEEPGEAEERHGDVAGRQRALRREVRRRMRSAASRHDATGRRC